MLILAALLPVLVFATIMTARFWNLQREAFEQRFLERVRALRLAADTELQDTIQTLRALAASTAATEPPFNALQAEFENFVAVDSGWATMGIVDATIINVKPDISIVDIGLPGFDGLEVARRLKRAHEINGVTQVALSGYGSPQDRAALAVGFAGYMVKPFDEAALRVFIAGKVPGAST